MLTSVTIVGEMIPQVPRRPHGEGSLMVGGPVRTVPAWGAVGVTGTVQVTRVGPIPVSTLEPDVKLSMKAPMIKG